MEWGSLHINRFLPFKFIYSFKFLISIAKSEWINRSKSDRKTQVEESLEIGNIQIFKRNMFWVFVKKYTGSIQ